MIDPNRKTSAVKSSDVCYRAFELMKLKQFDDAERLLVSNMAKTDDDPSVALYHSALGVICKLKGDFKEAWRHYERAEKLLPQDPALKLISARLLIDHFAQYQQAIKKAERVLELMPNYPVFAHQAYTMLGLAYLKKGEKKKAVKMLEKSMGEQFSGFVSAKNIDWSLVEALLKQKSGIEACGVFFDQAIACAEATQEENELSLFHQMKEAYDQTFCH